MENPFKRINNLTDGNFTHELREQGYRLVYGVIEQTMGLAAHTGVMLFDDPEAQAHRDRVRKMELSNRAYHYGKDGGGDSC